RHNVTDVVRCCEPTYRAETLQAENIAVHDWPFRDGAVPPSNIIKNWLQLVDSRIVRRPSQRAQRSISPSNSASDEEDDIQAPTIAVHCVAGLGRAPILVAIALIELGMANLDTVEFIRKRRRGCFNSNQIQYIDGYKRGKVLKHALGSGPSPASSSSSAAGGGGGGGGGGMKSGFSKMRESKTGLNSKIKIGFKSKVRDKSRTKTTTKTRTTIKTKTKIGIRGIGCMAVDATWI
ncbi:Protein tyrosine phosphatase type IVA 1, partial [Mortierella alpina]